MESAGAKKAEKQVCPEVLALQKQLADAKKLIADLEKENKQLKAKIDELTAGAQ